MHISVCWNNSKYNFLISNGYFVMDFKRILLLNVRLIKPILETNELMEFYRFFFVENFESWKNYIKRNLTKIIFSLHFSHRQFYVVQIEELQKFLPLWQFHHYCWQHSHWHHSWLMYQRLRLVLLLSMIHEHRFKDIASS